MSNRIHPEAAYLGRTILFYPGEDSLYKNTYNNRPIPAMVTVVHSDWCVDLELLVGPTRGLSFTSVTHEETPTTKDGEGHPHACWAPTQL